ncbi:MAG TPA: hypothetical protein ENK37_02315 [Oceanithermus profundus]|uniref:Uncharacterized protein n=1 Tax=Oceanithermus profundus TaxID=187137 RepID=A0A7C4Z4U1_9DEIN|nr:hypothetical protein [Oceanithermus profundus]
MHGTEFSPEEALRQAKALRSKAGAPLKRFVAQLLLLWGAIYLGMYGLESLGVAQTGLLWIPVDLAGVALSFGLGARLGTAIRSPEGLWLRRIWASFAFLIAATVAVLLIRDAAGYLDFVINLLAAYALLLSGMALTHHGLIRGGLLLLAVNAVFFALLPSLYAPALAVMGLVALVAGLRSLWRYAV